MHEELRTSGNFKNNGFGLDASHCMSSEKMALCKWEGLDGFENDDVALQKNTINCKS